MNIFALPNGISLILWSFPITRQSSHHSPTLSQGQDFPSGTALRKALVEGTTIDAYVPHTIIDDMHKVIAHDVYVDYERYYDILHGLNRLLSAAELETYGDFTEGIEHRWHKAMQQVNWTHALEGIKTKTLYLCKTTSHGSIYCATNH